MQCVHIFKYQYSLLFLSYNVFIGHINDVKILFLLWFKLTIFSLFHSMATPNSGAYGFGVFLHMDKPPQSVPNFRCKTLVFSIIRMHIFHWDYALLVIINGTIIMWLTSGCMIPIGDMISNWWPLGTIVPGGTASTWN